MAKEMLLLDKNTFKKMQDKTNNATDSDNHESMLSYLPDTIKTKAGEWLNFLKTNFSGVFDWNSKGDIFINGKAYKGTNVATLLKNIIRLTQNSEQPTIADLLLVIVKSLVCDDKQQTGGGNINYGTPKPIVSQKEKEIFSMQNGSGINQGDSNDEDEDDEFYAVLKQPKTTKKRILRVAGRTSTGPPGKRRNKDRHLKKSWILF